MSCLFAMLLPALLSALPTQASQPLRVDTDLVLSGQVRAASLHVSAGATLWADGPLHLEIEGALVIEGSIRCLPGGAAGSDGSDLLLRSDSAVVILGSALAGDGAPGLTPHARGGDGGTLHIRAPLVSLAHDLQGATGGAGGPGGDGGSGGAVQVDGRLLNARPGIVDPVLRGGAGGAGGDGSAQSPDGGRGGDGGYAGSNGSPGQPGQDQIFGTPAAPGSPGNECGPGGSGLFGLNATGGIGGPGGDGDDNLPFGTGGNGGAGGNGGMARGQDGGAGGSGGPCCNILGVGGSGGPGGKGGNAVGGSGGAGGDGGDGFNDGAGGKGGNGGLAIGGKGGNGAPGGGGSSGGPGGNGGLGGTASGGSAGPVGSGSPNGAPGSFGGQTPGLPGSVGIFGSVCGPWQPVGAGKAGLFGLAPQLNGLGSLVGGSSTSVHLTLAYPQSSAALVLGFSSLGAPFKGGTLHPNTDLVVTGLPTSVGGQLSIPFSWPTGVPAGFATYIQFWVTDPSASFGFSASNGLRAVGQGD